ncbi:MAG TPA: Mur ligase family protein [Caldisericia bacterium]|nr:Mur ligase family protein [Caldisericia bacterium]
MNLLEANGKAVHLVGIGGVGMTALAWYLNDLGWIVSGSDAQNFRMRALLEARGVKVQVPPDPIFLCQTDLLIYSSAIPQEHPELTKARQNHVPLLERMEAIHLILNKKRLVGITGSYGKSTTTTFVSSMMHRSGMEPDWLIGADLLSYPPARCANSPWMVLECDESKSKFLDLCPENLLICNVGRDHLQEYDHSMQKLADAFARLSMQVPPKGCIVLNGDDELLASTIQKQSCRATVITCGFKQECDFSLSQIQTEWTGKSFITRFELTSPEGKKIQACIPMPGWQNALDALMAYALIYFHSNKLPDVDLFSCLPVMDRRMEVKVNYKQFLLLDDEGDSPDVIEWALKAVRNYFPTKKIISVVQAHRYTRLKNLYQEYARVLSQCSSDIILLPVYAAGEVPLEGVNADNLAKQIMGLGFKGSIHLAENHSDAVSILQSELDKDSLAITLGPGDVWKVGDLLSDDLKTYS